MNLHFLKFIIPFLLISSCLENKEYLLQELSPEQTGITFANTLQTSPELNILNYLYYYNGAGVVSADFNNDGLIDLFFTGNQVTDELYINLGALKFQKINQLPEFQFKENWSTGATHVDINNDGLLDIYICKVSGYRKLKGHNLLYVNQGNDENGIPIFKEEAAKYGLAFSGLSTHASFFDYDLDGDLDLYLLNHSVHPNRNYGMGKLREGYHPQFGDILFENNNGYFEDISEKAGIFQGKTGYGLGLSIGDVNNDGYPDIYVGNDFFENDYLYINQKNGVFKELISNNDTQLGHTTHFSMGNVLSDLNNDGLQDILSLDMLPEKLKTYKTSGLEYAYPIYRQYLNKGYAPQFMQNTLHLNLGHGRFSEIAHLSNIAATEWSWGVLPVDLDNDGYKDLFIANGILGATNDMDYMNYIANDDIQRRIDQGLQQRDLPLVNEIPEKKAHNYIFKNNGDLTFLNVSAKWSTARATFSNGSTYADLDNDGDLDIVVNNINEPITLLENRTASSNYLKVQFEGEKKNLYGIGAKVSLYSANGEQHQENFPTKGYLSAVAPQLHFGLGKDTIIDSLLVKWPDGNTNTLQKIPSNQTITLKHKLAESFDQPSEPKVKSKLIVKDSILSFVHQENVSLDFDREPLIPYANSNEGPAIAVTDINKDGREDIFIGGAKAQSSRLYLQNNNGSFIAVQDRLFEQYKTGEVTASQFIDVNNDEWPDLIIGYGGNEFTSGKNLRPRLFLNNQGTLFETNAFDEFLEGNIASIEGADLDGDGDQDLILTYDQTPGEFGKTPKNHILFNNGGGQFKEVTSKIAPEFEFLGNLKHTKIIDLNFDGKPDFVAVGHWTPISVFINTGNGFELQKNNGLQLTQGWWNHIEINDFDNDGDFDFIIGNWGLNSKFTADVQKPITLYRNDFDDNGTVEPLVTYFHKNIETPFASKDELVKQMPFLNKDYLSYSKFASASLEDLFSTEKLKNSKQKKVVELETCYFENLGNNRFKKKKLPRIAQISQIREILSEDINNDGFLDIFLMGNNYHISTQLGRLDALHGLILYNDGKGNFMEHEHLQVDGQVNAMEPITVQNQKGYMIGLNNTSPIFLTKKDSL